MRRASSFCTPTLLLCLVIQAVVSLLLLFGIANQAVAAAPSVTTSIVGNTVTENASTQIIPPPPGGEIYGIQGGQTVGSNLFHSFSQFNVGPGDIAQFQTSNLSPTLAIHNILGRITSQSASSIFGTIDSATYYPAANLFLLNPYGFLFGATATVNVGGMVGFTSADHLRLEGTGGNGIFYADAAKPSVLTTAPMAAFGFLGSNPGAITVQGSQLTVWQGISLVGGDITIQSGTLVNGTVQSARLSAPGGQINLAIVASPGEILASTMNQAPNINGQSFGALGSVQVLEQSHIDASGSGGGTVLIRGGQFLLDNSTISANVTGPGPIVSEAESIGGGIDIQVSHYAVIQNAGVLETNISGNATPEMQYGGVHVKADRIEILGSQDFALTGIRSDIAQGNTGGNSGNITLEANSIFMQDFGTFSPTIESVTQGAGNSGNIVVKANNNIEMEGFSFIQTASSGDYFFAGGDFIASGNAGNIAVTSANGNISLNNGATITSQMLRDSTGNVGAITMNALNGDVNLTGTPDTPSGPFESIQGNGGAPGHGGIQVNARNLNIVNSSIQTDNFTPFVPADITLNLSGTLNLSSTGGPSQIVTTTRGPATSANLNITAHDVIVTGDSALISTESRASGPGSQLNIFADTVQLLNGGQLRSSSGRGVDPSTGRPIITSGSGGTISIEGPAGPTQSVLIDGSGSGIFTNAVGTGAGGNSNISARSLTIQNGGAISAATSGTAPSATGGTITVNANSVTLQNGAQVSSSSTGAGNTGNIQINAGNLFEMTNSSVTTEANFSSGGTIKITTTPSGTVELSNSLISASVHDGAGGGGSVNIDPLYVLMQNSQILAQAVQGPGGNITINITNGGLFLPDANSTISASSQFGVNGTVTIQNPNAPAGGHIQPLGQSPLLATSLLNQRCAALVGSEFSSFTVAGRDSLPTEPGSWLTSPLTTLSAGPRLGVKAEGGRPVARGEGPGGDTQILSLRQIAPAGFLTQTFAVDSPAGCQS